jgi:hypothetical protein
VKTRSEGPEINSPNSQTQTSTDNVRFEGNSELTEPSEPKNGISSSTDTPCEVMREKGSEGSAEGYARMVEARMAEIAADFESSGHQRSGVPADQQDQRNQRNDPNCFKDANGDIIENNKSQRVDHVENPSAGLSVEGVLKILEDSNTGAHKNALRYSAGETALEYLVRAVLFARRIPTEGWQQYTNVVEEAFEEWRKRGQ